MPWLCPGRYPEGRRIRLAGGPQGSDQPPIFRPTVP